MKATEQYFLGKTTQRLRPRNDPVSVVLFIMPTVQGGSNF